MNALCQIRDLSVIYRGQSETALQHINLDILDGEKLAIVGESGSGKSTLARTIAELLPPHNRTRGAVRWSGEKPSAGKDIGFVFQDPSSSLNPVLTIGEQVAEGAKRHLDLTWAQANDRAIELLHRVGLPEPEKSSKAFPHQLSGGQRQRVAIAAALSARPGILIADEPTSALDTVVQAEIVSLLDDLVRETGMTLIFVTHDIALASNLADRIAILHHGHLIETGQIGSVLSSPEHAYTRALLVNHLDLESPPLIREATL